MVYHLLESINCDCSYKPCLLLTIHCSVVVQMICRKKYFGWFLQCDISYIPFHCYLVIPCLIIHRGCSVNIVLPEDRRMIHCLETFYIWKDLLQNVSQSYILGLGKTGFAGMLIAIIWIIMFSSSLQKANLIKFYFFVFVHLIKCYTIPEAACRVKELDFPMMPVTNRQWQVAPQDDELNYLSNEFLSWSVSVWSCWI